MGKAAPHHRFWVPYPGRHHQRHGRRAATTRYRGQTGATMKFCPWCRKPLMFPMYGCDFCKLFQPASGFSREEIEDDERQNGETMNRREALQALPALGLLAAAENTERNSRKRGRV